MILLAEEQQKQAQALLDKLSQERSALTQETKTLQKTIEGLGQTTRSLKASLESTTQTTIKNAVTDTLEQVSSHTQRTLEEAATPLLGQLRLMNHTAEEVTQKLQGASKNVNLFWGTLTMIGCLALITFGYFVTQWFLPSKEEIQALRQEKEQLQQTIEQLSQKGARAHLSYCDQRLCIEVLPNAGTYGDRKHVFMVMKGY